jgi:hypothetical protein
VTSPTLDVVAQHLRDAFGTHDLDQFGAMLADDVLWGDDEGRCCRGRADVLATFSRLLGQNIDTDLADIVVGRSGVLAVMQAHWSDERQTRSEAALFHVYFLHDGLVAKIGRYNDRATALAAIDA